MVASGQCVLSQSRPSHIPVLEGTSVFRQPVLQALARLTNVHLEAIRAGDLIHPLLFVGPLVQGPWGKPVGGVECEVGGKTL